MLVQEALVATVASAVMAVMVGRIQCLLAVKGLAAMAAMAETVAVDISIYLVMPEAEALEEFAAPKVATGIMFPMDNLVVLVHKEELSRLMLTLKRENKLK